MTILYAPGLASEISKLPLRIGARSVSVADSAQARTPASRGVTVPFIDPSLCWENVSRSAAAMAVAPSLMNNIRSLLFIESLTGFIEDQQGWILDQRSGQEDHALLSGGQLCEAAVSKGLEG